MVGFNIEVVYDVSIPMTVLGGLQHIENKTIVSYNVVSIPMTVLGGLQHDIIEATDNTDEKVSIPMTVLGGLQHCAPEPLGLLAPDE